MKQRDYIIRKNKFEKDLLKMVEEFEKETGVYVNAVEIRGDLRTVTIIPHNLEEKKNGTRQN